MLTDEELVTGLRLHLREMRRDLAAAEKVVAEARRHRVSDCGCRLCAAVAAYDEEALS